MDLERVRVDYYTSHLQTQTVSATYEAWVYCSFIIIEILLNKHKHMNQYWYKIKNKTKFHFVYLSIVLVIADGDI